MSIYDLPSKFIHLDQMIQDAENDETLTEALANAKIELLSDLDSAADYLLKSIANAKADQYAIETEVSRLRSRADSLESRIDSKKALLKELLEAAGVKKYGHPLVNCTVAEGSESVDVFDLSSIPDDLVTVIPAEFKPDKSLIKKAIKDGREVPGARIVKGPTVLRIK